MTTVASREHSKKGSWPVNVYVILQVKDASYGLIRVERITDLIHCHCKSIDVTFGGRPSCIWSGGV